MEASGAVVESKQENHSSDGEETDVNKNPILSAWQSVESKGKLSYHKRVEDTRKSSLKMEKRKRWETGLLKRFKSTSFHLYFEKAPVWLMSLEPYFVETIYFDQYASFSELRRYIVQLDGVYVDLLSRFDTSIFKFNANRVSACQSSSLTLVSGSLTFLQTVLPRVNNSKMVYILDEHCKIRKIPDFRPKLRRVTHSQFGGGTKYESLFTSFNVELSPSYTTLRRDISSFLDFSQFSKPWLSPHGDGTDLHQFELYPILANHEDLNVVVESQFSSSGFGLRKLTTKELASLFGLPRTLHPVVTRRFFPVVPTQILDGLLHPLLEAATLQQDERAPKRLRLPDPIPDDTPVFLSALNRTLPPLWAKSDSVSQQAAKHDDAAVDFQKWDLRVTSLWPRSTFLIPALRGLLLRRQFRLLFLEYTSYLRSRYGRTYETYLQKMSLRYLGLFHKRLGGLGRFSNLSYCSEIRKDIVGTIGSIVIDSTPDLRNLREELKYGAQCLSNYLNSNFFSWDKGSSLLYWRWTNELRGVARYSFQPCISGALPLSRKKASTPKQPIFDKIFSKVTKALARGYLQITPSTKVKNLIDYFGVAKGETDIRVVFNGTSCGLNDRVWAPNFWLPTARSMIRATSYNFKFVDIDLGEMFLNFPLHKTLIPYSGVDLTPFQSRLAEEKILHPKLEADQHLYATWQRDWMGFKPSPEWACRYYYFAEEFIRGNEEEKTNPLYWKNVVLNLMGNKNFNPSLPSVYKWDDVAQQIAGEIKAYVDDLRTIGRTLEHAWAIARLVASRLQYLGIQDAPRKRRVDNGPWAGTVYNSDSSKIQTTVTQLKWQKGKDYITFIENELKDNPDATFEFKMLERIRGFLCHLAMTYDILFPYLKGFHLTLCSHLPKRDEEGWKRSDLEWIGYLEERLDTGKICVEEFNLEMKKTFDPTLQPKRVKPVGRFFECFKALQKFFTNSAPPIVTHRSSNYQLIAYGFADASKGGFGASVEYQDHSKFRVGVWGKDMDNDSSNFREFNNIVETIEEEEKLGNLNNVTLILATDNSTVESALYKGNSTSPKLFDLIVRFRHAELKSGGTFLVTHVSGNRMKSQGTDGISRGEMKEGVSVGECMLKFCPWGQNALERSTHLRKWLTETFGKHIEYLTPNDWFRRGHDHIEKYKDTKGFWRIKTKPGTFIWTPPPAAADAALEELRKARLKRQKSTHIIVIPRLMTTLWLKQLNKAADLIVYLPNKYSFWNHAMHEPLVIAFCFPFLSHRPWQLKGTPKVCATARQLQSMFKNSEMDPGGFLRKFCDLCERLPTMQECMVQKLLYFGRLREVSQTYSTSGVRKRRRLKPDGERVE